MYVCRQVTGVPSLAEYEVHVCPKGCLVRFKTLNAQSPSLHLATCDGCHLCQCERCKAPRFELVDGKHGPALMCYLLHDVFTQFAQDVTWYANTSASREKRSGPWHGSKACSSLEQRLKECGYDPAVVCPSYGISVCRALCTRCSRPEMCTSTCSAGPSTPLQMVSSYGHSQTTACNASSVGAGKQMPTLSARRATLRRSCSSLAPRPPSTTLCSGG